MYKHGAKVEPQTKATVRCSARPIIGLKETDSLSKYGHLAREVEKVPLFGMGDSINAGTLRGTNIFALSS